MPAEPRTYIVDTNVLSNRRDADENAVMGAWFRRYGRIARVSLVTVAAMDHGLLLLERKAAAASSRDARARMVASLRRKRLWQAELIDRFRHRIESIDLAVARKWAEVSVHFPSLRDGDKAIAATALARGYGVATRNVGDFSRAGVKLVNLFDPGTWDDGVDDDGLPPLG
jgi:predicted nucleic acid-binding protein